MRWPIAATVAMLAGCAFAEDVPQCSRWTAEMVEDEGGPVLAASSCATDAPDVYMTLYCAVDTVLLRYDMANGAETDPELDQQQQVTFDFGDAQITLQLQFEAMDGQFATSVPAVDPFVTLLASGTTMRASPADVSYPTRRFGLAGSASALSTLLAQCN